MARLAILLRRATAGLALASLHVAAAGAQESKLPDGRTTVPRDTANLKAHQTLFTYRDALLAAGFVGLTVAMFPLDKHIAESLQDEDLQANRFFSHSATGVELITSPGAFVIGGGLYAVGKLGGYKDVADLGWHGTEALLLASATTNLLKGIAGRSRPNVTADTNPHDFHFGWGFGGGKYPPGFRNSDYTSFPSGHTTTAFAAAAAVTSETRRMWPKSVWFVAPAMYGGATLVGLSRMYHNRHWASDVVLGAAIGTFSGLKVVRYSHYHPDNRLDRLLLGASIAPLPGGASVAFSIPVP